MQPRSLDQILAELRPTSQPQIDLLRQRQGAIPGQVAEEEKGLQAKQTQAFDSILGGARQRGIGFSGIPLSEQAKYTSTEFLPALARARQAGQDRAFGLEEAILGINAIERENAMNIRQYEQQRYDDAQEAARARAGQASDNSWMNSLFGGGGSTQGAIAGNSKMVKKSDGGFAFTDESGRSISAATFYAKKKAAVPDLTWRGFLQELANQGDKGARYALGFSGDDGGYDPSKVLSPAAVNIYNSLTWGSGLSPAQLYKAPQKNKPSTRNRRPNAITNVLGQR